MSEAVDTATQAAPEAPQGDEFEVAARKGGWLPQDEFEGPPDKWKDAKTYVLNAAEIVPNMSRELREARDEIKGVKKTLRDFGQYHSQTAKREYERAVKDVEAKINAAHVAGDGEALAEAVDELAEIKADARTGANGAPGGQAEEPEWFAAWRGANPWFGKDKPLSAAAGAIAQELMEDGLNGKTLSREVDKRLREQFPAKFEKPINPNRESAASVEGAGTPRGQRGKSYADLPPGARTQCDDFVKRGILTKEQYVKDYQW